MLMMAKLNGSPLISIEGDRRICPRKGAKSSREFVYMAISAVPIMSVLRQVSANRATLTQGNFCSRASSNMISAGESNELSMESLITFFFRGGHFLRLHAVALALRVFLRLRAVALALRGTAPDFAIETSWAVIHRPDRKPGYQTPV